MRSMDRFYDDFDRTYRPFGPPPAELPVLAHETPDDQELDASGRAVVTRKDGRQRRRMTVYLPPDLAKRLTVHCARRERQMSEVMSEALAAFLS